MVPVVALVAFEEAALGGVAVVVVAAVAVDE